jgi:F-type H+-transporting ATPase subunit b
VNLRQALLLVCIVAAGTVAMAQEHGGHGFDEHAKRTIMWQLLNVSVMVAGLVYYLKTPIRKMFSDKRVAYMAAAERAEAARKLAEQEHMEIEVRLTKLESTADESVSRARAEAADMKKSLIAEAENMSRKIREEAEVAAQLEVVNAKNILRQQLISESVALAKSTIQTKVSSEDHKRLQGDFINNIQAGQQ